MKIKDVVNNVEVFGLERAIKESKYPMITDINKATSDITKGVISRGHAKAGSGHDNFLKGIVVAFDLTFTVKAWTEAERYHFLEFVSSQSTMHRITKFDLDDAYIPFVDTRIVEIMKEKVKEYNTLLETTNPGDKICGVDRDNWLKTLYLCILYSNPCGFKLTAGMRTNYQQLKTIYYQRKDHRLPEWRAFCEWIETLPYAKELILDE